MDAFKRYYEANKGMWDKFAVEHFDSPQYRTKEFLEGGSTLHSIELEELGDVEGKTLLHLQCHFGLDTLSWAREGAIVTGVDFSGEAIQMARHLAQKTGIDGEFIQANIYDLPQILHRQFDIVFTSYGVTCWLHDLTQWAEIITQSLREGGTFYLAEGHPLMWVFDWDDTDDFRIVRSYFHTSEPNEFEVDGSYAGAKIEEQNDYEWAWSMGDVLTALATAGLRIEFLHEFAKSPFRNFPFLKRSEEGYWVYDNPQVQPPLTYSIKASKV